MRLNAPLSLSLLVASLALPVAAQDDAPIPAEQHQGTVAYRAGGIGEDESKALQAARPHYSLSLTFSAPQDGHSTWESGVALRIKDASGTEVLILDDTGPFVLAQLAPGKYAVAATLHGHSLTRVVDIVGRKHRQLALQWGPEPSVNTPTPLVPVTPPPTVFVPTPTPSPTEATPVPSKLPTPDSASPKSGQ